LENTLEYDCEKGSKIGPDNHLKHLIKVKKTYDCNKVFFSNAENVSTPLNYKSICHSSLEQIDTLTQLKFHFLLNLNGKKQERVLLIMAQLE